MDDYRQDVVRRLERIERQVNEMMGVVHLVMTAGCALGAYALASFIASRIGGDAVGDITGAVAGVVTFFFLWPDLHRKTFR
jgi:cyanate permease